MDQTKGKWITFVNLRFSKFFWLKFYFPHRRGETKAKTKGKIKIGKTHSPIDLSAAISMQNRNENASNATRAETAKHSITSLRIEDNELRADDAENDNGR